jgi:hypothetical protein
MPASLLDYLPRQALVLVDDLDLVQVTANEIEEQSVKLRRESIQEGTLPADFPVPYVSWSELQDNLARIPGSRWGTALRRIRKLRNPLLQVPVLVGG